MTGFSWETSIGLILSLFVTLLVAPAGFRKASDQIISPQIMFGGTYLALSLLLLNTIIFVWFFNPSSMSASINHHLISLWSSFVSTTFGAVYWIILCMFFLKRQRGIAGVVLLLGWPMLMLFQNYLPEIYRWFSVRSELTGLRDETTDSIAIGLAVLALLVLNYVYWVHRERWAKL
jgi:hypothetical protein